MGISYVSAENIDDVSDLSTNDAEDIVSVDDSLDDNLAVEEGDLLSDPITSETVDSWSKLSSAVNNKDVVYINSSFAPGNQIQFTRSVTVIGSSGNYIGGSYSNHIASYSSIPFYTTSAVTVTLKNIKFQNCGGNIFMQFNGNGNYIVENCTFENITANGDHQAVLYLSLGNCNITNCTFEKCTTSYGTVSNYNSASVNNVHMTVRDTIFKGNYASVEPGAINNCGQLIVYDSIFENNEANWWAGAIHTHYNANTTIVRSTFRNNIAGWNGGALYTYSYLTVIDSNFTNNEAHYDNGGAIAASYYVSRPYVTIENCGFDSNIAVGSGGAISFDAGTIIIENSRFNGNVASAGTGGAISLGTSSSDVNNCIFTNNNASNKGGAIYASGTGYLNVYYSNFVNNTGSQGNDIAYYYTKKTNNAFLNYDYNEFWGAYNASGSIYVYNTQYLNVTSGIHNAFHDIEEYVIPSDENTTNETNVTIGDIIGIPENTHEGNVNWSVNLGDALSGTPVIVDDYILIPAGHTLYCYYNDGTYVWNVTSDWGYFHELLVDEGVVFAPCSWDKLYILDLDTGISLTNSNIYQGSSLYAPVMDSYGNIYIASEYGYGANSNLWITVVTYENEDYVYSHSILEINNISYGSPALLSQPIITETGCFIINTVQGLMIGDLNDGIPIMNIEGSISNFAIDYVHNYYFISMNTTVTCGVLFTDDGINGPNGFDMEEVGEILVIDSYANDYLYTITEDGYIYFVDIDYNRDYGYSARLYEDDDFQVNHVSSAMTAYNGMLYIGDDAGILWVVNTACSESATINNYLSWAFNTNSSIVGGIAVDNDIVYIGTEDGTFYALTY